MNSSDHTLMYWGLGLAAGAYALLSLYLVRQDYLRAQVSRTGVAMLAATLFTFLWSI